MWVPENPEQIERGARAGELTETPSFDAKAELPIAKRNADLAVDVAAMSTDGGVLLYGVGEDEHKVPTIPEPIALANAAERIDNIVSTSISEVPFIDVREYPCAADPSKGYIAVIVPQSARAPHQVVGGDLRFYGRGAKGNRRLTEGEVARLYQRRGDWERDRAVLLADAIAAGPGEPDPDIGYMYAFARPLPPDRKLWDRAEAGDRRALQQALTKAATTTGPKSRYGPTLQGGGTGWQQRGADVWKTTSGDQKWVGVECEINLDGRGWLFCGRAAERLRGGTLAVFEQIIADNLASFLSIMGVFYGAAGFHGHVVVGVAVVGIEDGVSSIRAAAMEDGRRYGASSYTRTDQLVGRRA